MISTGLCSEVFKELSPQKIIEMCVHSHIRRIEWDYSHIPWDDLELIEEIEKQCRLNLIFPIAYNTGLTVTGKEDIFEQFTLCCECARKLRAPAVNITIGAIGNTDEEYNSLVSQVKKLCQIANTLIVNIIPVYQSVISDADRALSFLSDVYMTTLKLYWTPDIYKSEEENKEVIRKIVKYTTNIYISNKSSKGELLPLKDAKTIWREYGSIIAKDRSRLHLFLLNGIDDNTSETLATEFSSLRYILAKV